ncbi:hypothetical protein [Roseicyclus amphidinii]|uniref:hypothetical protein n=1 Tax=Roseicyclus amphidinii TaxID=3034232 RepID=UPI0024E09142|nr:hypothetical protein [Roseicyclus sp. Amp-Y-6]
MNFAEDMWLRGQAVQRTILHVTGYSTAFAGNAALQTLHMGLSAPRSFWAAMARVAAAPASVAAQGTARVVPMTPDIPVSEAAVEPTAGPAATPHAAAAPEATPVAVAVPDPEPVPVPAPEPAAALVADVPSPHLLDEPRGGKADDLTVLAGVGPKLAAALNEFGIFHYDQLAALDEEGIAWLDAQQKGFRMICARHDIVGQARARK